MARPLKTVRRMMKIEDAEDYTGVSAKTLRDQVKKGRLRAYRPGGGKYSRLVFAQDDLDSWLESCEVTGDAE